MLILAVRLLIQLSSELCNSTFNLDFYDSDFNPVTFSCSGLLSISGYAVYAQYVSVEYFNPDFNDLK